MLINYYTKFVKIIAIKNIKIFINVFSYDVIQL